MLVSAYVVLSAFVASITANPLASRGDAIICSAFHAEGTNPPSDQYKINFYNNNPTNNPALGPSLPASTLPSNATWSPSEFVLDTEGSGSSFELTACNSTEAGIVASTQSSCYDGGCSITYTTFVQVKPTTGNRSQCLTDTAFNSIPNATTLVFQTCPTTFVPSQFFIATQQVSYSPGYGSVTSYGVAQLSLSESGAGNPSFRALSLDPKDNTTIQVVGAEYTQVGLSANLVNIKVA